MNPLFAQVCAWPHVLQSRAWAEFKSRWGWQIVNLPTSSLSRETGEGKGGGVKGDAPGTGDRPLSRAAAYVGVRSAPGAEVEGPSAGANSLSRVAGEGGGGGDQGGDQGWGGGAISLLARRVGRLPFPVLYVPKGPNVAWLDAAVCEQTLARLEQLARARRAFFVKIDPDVPLEQHAVTDVLRRRGWHFSGEQVQYRNTMLLDLNRSEEQLLAAMKPKWRYNIRLAERRGVAVERVGGPDTTGDESGTAARLNDFYALYAETSARDGFLIRPFEYYHDLWSGFLRQALASLFLAYFHEQMIAGIMLFVCGQRAWYFYGASANRHRELMPNHLLQWRAIQWARSSGCQVYDFWGAPDEQSERDPMWGVYRFKEGFGAELFRGIGAWDFAPSRARYALYTRLMPRLIALMHRRHRAGARVPEALSN